VFSYCIAAEATDIMNMLSTGEFSGYKIGYALIAVHWILKLALYGITCIYY